MPEDKLKCPHCKKTEGLYYPGAYGSFGWACKLCGCCFCDQDIRDANKAIYKRWDAQRKKDFDDWFKRWWAEREMSQAQLELDFSC